MDRLRQRIVNANIQAARDDWNNSGLNRGADPEVLEDIGIVTPERLPVILARVLEAHGIFELDTQDQHGSDPGQQGATSTLVAETGTTPKSRKRKGPSPPLKSREWARIDVAREEAARKPFPFGYAEEEKED